MRKKTRHSRPPVGDETAAERKRRQLADYRQSLSAKRRDHSDVVSQLPEAEPWVEAGELRFLRPASLQPVRLSPALAFAVATFRQAVRSRQSTIILNWPNALPGVASLHGLAMLCELAEGPRRYKGLTTLFYPASARTGVNQKGLLIDREWLLGINQPWLAAMFQALREPAQRAPFVRARYHAVLARVGDLRPKSLEAFRRGQAVVAREADRGHPSLYEIVARRTLKADGELVLPDHTFLERCRRLSKLLAGRGGAEDGQRIEAADAAFTPWLLSTVHGASGTAFWNACTAPANRKPDALLIDLQYQARARLGENWKAIVVNAISRFRHGDLNLPVIAVTDDPFVANFARFDLSARPNHGRRIKPLPVSFSHQTLASLIAGSDDDALPGPAGDCPELHVDVFASDLAEFAAEALELRRATLKLADGAIARAIGICLARLRAMANSPLSQSQLGAMFSSADDAVQEDRLLETFNINGALAGLNSVAPYADRHEGAVDALVERARALALQFSKTADAVTRVKLLERLSALPKRATRTLVIAQNSAAAHLLESWIESDPALEFLLEKLGQKFDIAAPHRALAEIETASASTRPYGHVLALSPPPKACLALFASAHCPRRIEIVSDASSAKFLTTYGEALLKFVSDSAPVRDRIAYLVAAVQGALGKGLAVLPDFDLGDPVRSSDTVTDLTGRSQPGGADVLRLTTIEGETVLVGPETQLVARKPAALDEFEFILGRAVTPGREVLVPRSDFIASIGDAKAFRAAAAPLLSDYHDRVRACAAGLPGTTIRHKAEGLLENIAASCAAAPALASVERWIDVDRQADLPAELIVPQAPRSHDHFAALMKALGIDEALAEIYWHYGVIATRSGRIRSGFQMRRLYTAALVDPDALRRDNPAAGELVAYIHDLAAEFVTEIAEVALARETES